ncbi:hypothetical protein ACFCXT_37025 [Streptomyces vinaceus]|uniref:hypothetical protein n=1 Tax=Streptomyces vinaceus TaxID=1960 RepID=UPI0035DCB19A
MATFLAAVAGPENLARLGPVAGSSVVAGLALAFSYALGILVDRGADVLLASKRRVIRAQYFDSNADYDRARQFISTRPELVARADYARSRMRICRGWTLNSILLFGALAFLLGRCHFEARSVLIVVSVATGGILGFGFYVAWRNITVTSYAKLAHQAQVGSAIAPSQLNTESAAEGSATPAA